MDWSGSSVGIAVVVVAVVLGAVALAFKRAHARLLQIGIEQAAIAIEKAISVLNDPAPHDFAILSDHRYDDDVAGGESTRAFVDDKTAALQALGFRVLGDIEDRTVSAAQGLPAILRAFVSDDGTVLAAVFTRPGPVGTDGEAGPLVKIVEFSSARGDDRFIETVAGSDAPMLDVGPQIDVKRLPESTSPEDLLREHLQRRGDGCDRVADLDGAIQQAHRRQAVVAAARASIPGGITRAELNMLNAGTDDSIVSAVYEVLQRRAKERSSA